jgi:hypothetical protein
MGQVFAGGHGSQVFSRTRILGIAALTVLVTGCGSVAVSPAGGSAASVTPAVTAAAPTPVMAADDALRTYGYGPSADPSVTFQPDVVVVGGGPSSIRWASDDGHTWAIDPAAPGADKLQVGSVMLLTSRAVGRVVDLSDQGGSRIVAVGPVQLTELFSDANFDLDQPVDLGSMAYQALPETPGDVTTPSSPGSSNAADNLADGGASPSPGAMTMPSIVLAAYRGGSTATGATLDDATAKQLPPAGKACQEVTLAGKWLVKPCVEAGKISLGVDYKVGSGLKVGGSMIFRTSDPHALAKVKIQNGSLANPTVLLDGIKGIDVSVAAGTANGAKDDGKFKFEIPIEVELPIPPSPGTLGIPLNLVLEFKLLIEVALSGNNSTLQASASYDLDGAMGVQDGRVVSPKLTVNRSILDSISGITLGPGGVVFAAKFKLHFGVGMEGFIAGPYATTTFSVGISKGSVLGSPIANCMGAAIAMWVGGGAGVTLDFSKYTGLLTKTFTKFKNEVEKNWNVYTVSKTVPDSGACRAP